MDSESRVRETRGNKETVYDIRHMKVRRLKVEKVKSSRGRDVRNSNREVNVCLNASDLNKRQ